MLIRNPVDEGDLVGAQLHLAGVDILPEFVARAATHQSVDIESAVQHVGKSNLGQGQSLLPGQFLGPIHPWNITQRGERIESVATRFAVLDMPHLRGIVSGATQETDATVHNGGTYVVMEGPAFSTRAESNLYRTWGADIIGMTALPEAKLAREAEICFAVLACSTDYDCWRDGHEDGTAEMIVANLLRNVEVSRKAVRLALQRLPARRECVCKDALKDALVTSLDLVPDATKQRLGPIIGRYAEQAVSG